MNRLGTILWKDPFVETGAEGARHSMLNLSGIEDRGNKMAAVILFPFLFLRGDYNCNGNNK